MYGLGPVLLAPISVYMVICCAALYLYTNMYISMYIYIYTDTTLGVQSGAMVRTVLGVGLRIYLQLGLWPF